MAMRALRQSIAHCQRPQAGSTERACRGSKRDALLLDVPTAREAGLEDMVLDSWIGLFVPAKTPKNVLEKLRGATVKALQAPDTRKRLESNGWQIISMPPAETDGFVKSEAEKWLKFLQQAGIKPE